MDRGQRRRRGRCARGSRTAVLRRAGLQVRDVVWTICASGALPVSTRNRPVLGWRTRTRWRMRGRTPRPSGDLHEPPMWSTGWKVDVDSAVPQAVATARTSVGMDPPGTRSAAAHDRPPRRGQATGVKRPAPSLRRGVGGGGPRWRPGRRLLPLVEALLELASWPSEAPGQLGDGGAADNEYGDNWTSRRRSHRDRKRSAQH